jgi:hypothetical protein
MMPSGHKAFVVSNVKDVELLLMHNKIYAAEYVDLPYSPIHTLLRQADIDGATEIPEDRVN